MKLNRSKKGFTLVELVIVIAVIGILSAVLVPTFGDVVANAQESKRTSAISNAITEYQVNLNYNTETLQTVTYATYTEGTGNSAKVYYYTVTNGVVEKAKDASAVPSGYTQIYAGTTETWGATTEVDLYYGTPSQSE